MEKMLLEKRTIFSTNILGYYLDIDNYDTLKKRIYRLTKGNKLTRLKRGLFYITLKDYSKYECANFLYPPSYVSFETVLQLSGFIFQPYTSIFSAAIRNKKYFVDNTKYIYRKIDKEILVNIKGIEKRKNYFIATPERAVLDMIYVNENFYFDNLRNLDFEKAKYLSSIYKDNKKILYNLNILKKQYA